MLAISKPIEELMNPPSLNALVDYLEAVGKNYSVFLRVYEIAASPDDSLEEVVAKAFGNRVVLDNIRSVTPSEVNREVRTAFCFGDRAGGLDPVELKKQGFVDLLNGALQEIDLMSNQASAITRFYVRKGFPMAGMFWEFAFLFAGHENSRVLFGCAQD
jgi:hypothetical protein